MAKKTANEGPKARDVMTKDVIAIHHKMSLEKVLEVFARHNISGAPVADDEEHAAGVLSIRDVTRALAGRLPEADLPSGTFYRLLFIEEPETMELLENREGVQEALRQLTAADAMSREVIRVGPDAPVSGVAATMVRKRIHRVIVTSRGKILGLISSMDLLGVLAASTKGKRRSSS